MKISKKIAFFSVAMILFLGAIPASLASQKSEYEDDDMTYETVIPQSPLDYLRAGDAEVVCPNKVILHYHNDDGKNDTRLFYTWTDGVNGEERKPDFVAADKKDMSITLDFSVLTNYAGKEKMLFIIKYVGTWSGQSEDTVIDYAKFPPDDKGLLELWTIPGEGISIDIYRTEEETKLDKIQTAKFTDWKTIHCVATAIPTSYKIYAFDQTYLNMEVETQERDKELYLFKTGQPESAEFDIKLNKIVHLNILYLIESRFPSKPGITQKVYVTSEYLYQNARFEKDFTYDGDDLGATYTPEKTTFKVWAPTAANVLLKIYKSGTPKSLGGPTATSFAYTYRMVYQAKGIWVVTLTGDYNGKYYNYVVTNPLGTNEVVDPYAKACGVNGVRGMILDFSTTNPDNWDNDVPAVWNENGAYDITTPQELTIYEAHIRDLTMDETWQGQEERGTYNAFVEPNTTYTKGSVTVTTGFDHIEEMNVNAIQLTPVFDHDDNETFIYNDAGEKTGSNMHYNWGYNPLNYNCVEGGYSTDPYRGEVRVTEYKKLIQAFAKNNNHTRIIMDVVYNHVSSAANSSFTKLMPKYYFRYDSEWNYYNGSGCGNEVKTEATMMRKYIVDSLVWWATEYRVKGFRFDLMGLIDVKTMKKAKETLYAIDPDIYLYGEGWTGDGQDAHIQPYAKTHGANTYYTYNELYDSNTSHGYVGAFNNSGRIAIKGDNDIGEAMYGFISQGSEKVEDKSNGVADMLVGYHRGSGAKRFDPKQSVAYASCHDNYALFDQFTYTVGANGTSGDYPAIACIATASVECAILFSNSVAFIQGGEELFRSKEVRTEEDKALIRKVDEQGNISYEKTATIGGKMISHDSYNLSDDVNAYKWDRKISIGDTPTLDIVRSIQDAAGLRKVLTKYSKEQMEAHNPYQSGTDFHVFAAGGSDWNGNTVVGMQNGSFYFYIAGIRSGNFTHEAASTHHEVFFCSNSAGYSYPGGDQIWLGWSTCVCLTDSNHLF